MLGSVRAGISITVLVTPFPTSASWSSPSRRLALHVTSARITAEKRVPSSLLRHPRGHPSLRRSQTLKQFISDVHASQSLGDVRKDYQESRAYCCASRGRARHVLVSQAVLLSAAEGQQQRPRALYQSAVLSAERQARLRHSRQSACQVWSQIADLHDLRVESTRSVRGVCAQFLYLSSIPHRGLGSFARSTSVEALLF
ncbi:hypothetical protein EXIGLDRAFT_784087 [Exidia glandulosa HHB12029]|uniref:Uncharacterized protein n=1 Tax=Exidia glandulosa HHB12029 TaxID=1314781 RepID=A0A166MPN9_EXIGL|nr:hypothetical protein EXIGLDRAFT_784087 [Exidia glandulosa HHB12029]